MWSRHHSHIYHFYSRYHRGIFAFDQTNSQRHLYHMQGLGQASVTSTYMPPCPSHFPFSSLISSVSFFLSSPPPLNFLFILFPSRYANIQLESSGKRRKLPSRPGAKLDFMHYSGKMTAVLLTKHVAAGIISRIPASLTTDCIVSG